MSSPSSTSIETVAPDTVSSNARHSGPATALLATGLHALGYLMVTAFVALLVYEKLGLELLRKAWFNIDLLWAVSLIATGLAAALLL